MNDMQTLREYKDMYNIYNLITEIDKGYKLFFDTKEKCYKIVNTAKNNQICLKSYHLSPNIINLLKISRVENLQKILKKIDDDNENILNKNQKKFKNDVSDCMIECVTFSKRANSISNEDIKKIVGEKIC